MGQAMSQPVTPGNSDRLRLDRFGPALTRQHPECIPETGAREREKRRAAVKEWAIAMGFAAVLVAIASVVKFVLFLASPAGQALIR